MSVELSKVLDSLVEASKKAEKQDVDSLRDTLAVCNTWIESLSFFARHADNPETGFFEKLSDEIFLDLHTSVTLAHGGRLKAAGIILRASLETSIFAMYFAHHPIEAKRWTGVTRNGEVDMSFSATLEELASVGYAEAASGRECNSNKLTTLKNQLQSSYRELSERVHGKFSYLQVVSSIDLTSVQAYCDTVSACMRSLIQLVGQLVGNQEDFREKIPAVQELV